MTIPNTPLPAGLDRLLDQAKVLMIRGPSFRSQGRSCLLEKVKTDPVKLGNFIFSISDAKLVIVPDYVWPIWPEY